MLGNCDARRILDADHAGLTVPQARGRIEGVVMFSRHLRLVVLALTMTLSWSLWAACMDGGGLTQSAQMACCKDGEMTCGPHGSPMDCCRTEAARSFDAVVHAKAQPVHALVAVATWAVESAAISPETGVTQAFHPTSPPHLDLGPAPYIAYSSLLI